ncbi:COX15/CtaA family protein [Amphiplicatus metriothermophilus]|uniref:Heme A synthase n=1 Tax=Amphiplicatus metriothermophilus TaxID=1519374 RepID=A0A239PPP6_9PROT|nr:COX15/CtaA family protein [Amphiplicatus metriothermophilus]MBB5518834.1 cytochrome c oxidase assembly protein subunit 15 [Amphiplicatus metriothermophilus]SNT72013.1 cytochrome c oxidase assembly protein subunit 15 [Amphiplicatus metriothermophilus]
MSLSTSAAPAGPDMRTQTVRDGRAARRVSAWLFAMCALAALMVIVGGATRLTDSGLSITEWKPVTGAIPPLSEAQWLEEFEKYRQIPEYQIVNRGMSLDEFKTIYWWEWGHRFLGRLIGVAFLVPLAVFAATGAIGRALALKLFGIFLLGGAQGALGWYMVASGLSERVDVSQYRLAAHFGLAVVLLAAMFWLALDLRRAAAGRDGAEASPPRRDLFWGALALAAGVYLQMILGAFVAGLRAGRTYNTWPLMDGRFFPEAYFDGAPGFSDLFESIAAVQFNHRLGAYLLTAGAVWFWLAARRTAVEPRARALLVGVLAQAALGVWTLLAATPIALGLAHQAGALIVFMLALYVVHGLTMSMSITNGSSSS